MARGAEQAVMRSIAGADPLASDDSVRAGSNPCGPASKRA